MKTFYALRFTLCLLFLLLAGLPAANAQKISRKALRAIRAQEVAALKKVSADLTAQSASLNAAFRQLQHKYKADDFSPCAKIKKAKPAHSKPKKGGVTRHSKLAQSDINRAIQASINKKFPSSYKDLPFSPQAKIKQILNGKVNPVKVLPTIQQLQKLYPGYSFFPAFASVYYQKHFILLTPHLENLFQKVADFHNPKLERELIKRMAFLVRHKEEFQEAVFPDINPYGVRLRYIANISQLTPETFDSKNLILSFEQKMHPRLQTFPIGHIHSGSKFSAGNKYYLIRQYAGPLDYLPQLYSYLLNGDNPDQAIIVFLDQKNKSAAIYNKAKTVWIRISEHEYADPDRLHIHLNEIKTVDLVSDSGETISEKVNFNLSISFATPKNLPAHNRNDFLYREMILKPVSSLQQNPNVQVFNHPIF